MPNPELRTVANRLVELCRSNQSATVLDELTDPNVVSVEAMAMPGQDTAEVHGLEALRQKHAWWNSTFEVHEASCEGPFPHGDDRFAVIFSMDVTNRHTKQREQLREVAVYTVAAGKVVREEFFYG
ncbi:MAG: nuclear transport factor 2 family protein [Proteobacteria bacterium]|nr:nuclear transport factor 2 family protein [Burkholderiales bacterium]